MKEDLELYLNLLWDILGILYFILWVFWVHAFIALFHRTLSSHALIVRLHRTLSSHAFIARFHRTPSSHAFIALLHRTLSSHAFIARLHRTPWSYAFIAPICIQFTFSLYENWKKNMFSPFLLWNPRKSTLVTCRQTFMVEAASTDSSSSSATWKAMAKEGN